MQNIEVEIRSFIPEEKYQELLKFFRDQATLLKEDDQETFYFDCPQDLRIQRNNMGAKIWMKKGQLHDDQREEIEIRFDRQDFEKIENLFYSLGYRVEIKWLRKRFKFDWAGTIVCLDDTKGYGHIIELEQMSDIEHKDEALALIHEKLRLLNVDITPKAVFDQKFEFYKANWRKSF